MATFAKKIHIKNSAGTEQTANIYSTTGESGSPYMHASVDGSTGYVALVSTSASNATSGRVLHTNGTTYAIGNAAIPAYSYKVITTAGSGTFTVPTGVSKLRVTCVGGGAGGSVLAKGSEAGCGITYGSSELSVSNGTYYWTGSWALGSATKFGTVTAAAAGAAKFSGVMSEQCTCTSGRDVTCSGCRDEFLPKAVVTVSTGYHNGVCVLGTSNSYKGGAAVPMVGIDNVTRASVGAGGYADGDYNNPCTNIYIASGGSGYRTISTMSVTAGQVISYTVGSGGKMRWFNGTTTSCHNSDGTGGCPGSAGGILIEWGKGIE